MQLIRDLCPLVIEFLGVGKPLQWFCKNAARLLLEERKKGILDFYTGVYNRLVDILSLLIEYLDG